MYRSNRPATEHLFRNRRVEVGRLSRLVDDLEAGEARWVALIGSRKVGKTSLLLELARLRESDTTGFAILDSFEDAPISRGIFRLFAVRVLDATLGRRQGVSLEALLPSPADYRAAVAGSSIFAQLDPATRRTVLELPDLVPAGDGLRRILELPESIAAALSGKLVVAWDEFQELARLGSTRSAEDPLPVMRAIWQRHERVMYVISGSERGMLERLVTDERSPFFQHFEMMELGEFPRDEAIALLCEGAPADRPVPEPVARLAVDVLGRHPFYLQMLGETLTAMEPPYDDSALKQALQELLFNRVGRLSLFFENQFRSIVGRSTYLAATLNALSGGARRLTDIAEAIGARSGETARYLERLGDAVEKCPDGRYALLDDAFALWLAWRSPGGTVVPMTQLGDEGEKRVAVKLARLGFDLVYQSRASRGAFDLLATRGSDQLGIQVKRSTLPLRFSRMEWQRMEAESVRLGWRWLVAAALPGPGNEVLFLDPEGARLGREHRLGRDAEIENVLLWLNERRRNDA